MILFFGKLHDAAGVDRMDCPLERLRFSLSELVSAIDASVPGMGDALRDPGVRVAVNKQMAPKDEDVALSRSDEIAFMPPLSGG